MKTVDMMATDCVRDFEHWLATQSRGEPVGAELRALLLQAFVAGYERGGRQGADQMYRETLAVINRPRGASPTT